MENQRTILLIALVAISFVLFQKWTEFNQPNKPVQIASGLTAEQSTNNGLIPNTVNTQATADDFVPATPINTSQASVNTENPAQLKQLTQVSNDKTVRVVTDFLTVVINTHGGVIQRVELNKEPVSLEKVDQGFPLLKREGKSFVAQDGLLVSKQKGPNHSETYYSVEKTEYQLNDNAEKITVPFSWVADNGTKYTKNFIFTRGSYVVDINYVVENNSAQPWSGFIYGQFSRNQPNKKKGGFGQLPSYAGGAIYTAEDKYQKIKFGDMEDENLMVDTDAGWVGMLQHYFVAAWIPANGVKKQFYTSVDQSTSQYRIGYKTMDAVKIAPNDKGSLNTSVYLGSKEQTQLHKAEENKDIQGLVLTVDYGIFTIIADPIFTLLVWIHKVVGNWGWSIILLTLLIKLAFYPLSAASYKSMAGMKKLQPRIQTLKDRYKDDRQKFQMEMMALYKKEKINHAGGCLPILIQIPVFISLYWVLLESVEMRHAPFALWLQDLSSPDPYYILPVLMGLSMWAQQKLNPAPMEDIQKKVMMIMPIVLTFLFLNFPQGLVLYWVVNNVLSMLQQWWINKQHAS